MQKAGGIIAIIAGVFGVFAAFATLMIGGFGAALEAEGSGSIVGMGGLGVLFAFITIALGAVALGAKSNRPAILIILSAVVGAVTGGSLVAIFMVLALIGGVLALIGANKVAADGKVAFSEAGPEQ